MKIFKKMELLKTGIPKLDMPLGGGIKPCSIILFWAQPGIENAPFAYQFVIERMDKGDKGVYVIESKRTDTVKQEMEEYGWDIKEYLEEETFTFIDAYSGLIHAPSKERFIVRDARNPKAITSTLKEVLEETSKEKHKIVIFDSISTFIDHCGEHAVDELKIWKSIFQETNSTGIFLFTEWPYKKKTLDKVRLISDAIVSISAVEEKVILREYFHVSKVSWDGKEKSKIKIPFKIISPGGVKVYIPKILVTGPYNAGKSSFVHSASTRAVSVDRLGTTIALDHGHVDYSGFSVDLFGTPGQERFDPILELLGGEALGVIVVVDSTDPETFLRAKEMLEKSKSVGLPYVIAANKANLEGALKTEEIREAMGLPKDIPIVPVIAEKIPKVKGKVPADLNQDYVHKVLDSLFDKII
jgi:hypothetical protein